MYKPADFFLSVIDFFGILVPGSIFVFFHRDYLISVWTFPTNGAVAWVAFFIGSYILGNFLLGLGVPLNRLLDICYLPANDAFYNEVKTLDNSSPGVTENRTELFYRAYTFIRQNSLSALSDIDRYMADYKLFRSLTLVFFMDLVSLSFRGGGLTWDRGVISGLLFVIAMWRFLFLLHWTYRVTFEHYALLLKSRHAEGTLVSPKKRTRKFQFSMLLD